MKSSGSAPQSAEPPDGTSESSSDERTNSVAAIALIVAGSFQLIHATLMFVQGFAAGAFDIAAMLFQSVAEMEKNDPKVTGAENARAFANAAFSIGVSGMLLAVVAIVSGILLIKRKHSAQYWIAGFVILCVRLAALHWSIRWYVCVAIYVGFGVSFSVYCMRSKDPVKTISE